MHTQPKSKIYIGWLMISLFFIYQYILRLTPGILSENIRNLFGMSAKDFSFLGSYYQFAYAFMLIPIGILLDRFGVRKIVLYAIGFCVFGAFLLTSANSIFIAKISRIFVGIGSSAAFTGAFKLIADAIPKGKQGFFMGMTVMFGTLGAYASSNILVNFVQTFGWPFGLVIINSFGILLWIGCLVWLPKNKSEEVEYSTNWFSESFKISFGKIIRNRNVWLYTFLATGIYGSVSSFSDLWGAFFLISKFKLSVSQAVKFAMFVYLGMAVGGLFIPWFAEKYNYIKRTIFVSSILLSVFFIITVYTGIQVNYWILCSMFGLGIVSGAEVVCFAGVTRHCSKENSGFTLGLINSIDMLGGAFLQQSVGYSLDFFWLGSLNSNGIRVYSGYECHFAFALFVTVAISCIFVSLLLPKDKKH